MDYVYVVRPGERNEELRYSLRSLEANLPRGTVWIAGHCPAWLRGVHRIEVEQNGDKHANAERNLRAAVDDPRIRDRFVLLNDDFFIMARMREVPVLHRGPLARVLDVYRRIRRGTYFQAMERTADLIESYGIRDALSYEMHAPLVVDKAVMADALAKGAHIPRFHLRTLYGNLGAIGGQQSPDVKVYSTRDRGYQAWPFLSTTDSGFYRLPAGAWIRSRFPTPSRYEA